MSEIPDANDEVKLTWQKTIDEKNAIIYELREAIYEYERLIDSYDTITTHKGRERFKKYIRDNYDWRSR